MDMTPAMKLRAEIARRKSALKLAPFGIGEVLDLVDAWVASVEQRLERPAPPPAMSEEQVRAMQRPVCEDCES